MQPGKGAHGASPLYLEIYSSGLLSVNELIIATIISSIHCINGNPSFCFQYNEKIHSQSSVTSISCPRSTLKASPSSQRIHSSNPLQLLGFREFLLMQSRLGNRLKISRKDEKVEVDTKVCLYMGNCHRSVYNTDNTDTTDTPYNTDIPYYPGISLAHIFQLFLLSFTYSVFIIERVQHYTRSTVTPTRNC